MLNLKLNLTLLTKSELSEGIGVYDINNSLVLVLLCYNYFEIKCALVESITDNQSLWEIPDTYVW